MGRGQKLFLVGLLLLAALLALLIWRNRQPPFLPQDADHRQAVNSGDCLACHGEDGGYPRGENHPLGFDCARCHGTP